MYIEKMTNGYIILCFTSVLLSFNIYYSGQLRRPRTKYNYIILK